MRKVLLLFLTLLSIICFCACGEQSYERPFEKHTCKYSWQIKTEATCTENGVKKYECTLCGEILYGDSIPSRGEHVESGWITDLEPTCTEDGKRHKECDVCKEILKEEVVPSFGGHTYSEWTIDIKPTCKIDGKRHKKCIVCSELITDVLPSTHEQIKWEILSYPTCAVDGEMKRICLVCAKTVDSNIIPATGHTGGEWITDVKATCLKDGEKHQVCATCNETVDSNIIPATGHTGGEWITDVKATCLKDGKKHQVCATCNETVDNDIISATGHDYDEKVNNVTCISSGSVEYDCKNCEDYYMEEILPLTAKITKTSWSSVNDNYKSVGYSVHATGGYGKYSYKYEVFSSKTSTNPSLTEDFSENSSFGFSSSGILNNCVLKVTIKDEVGNEVVYRIFVDDDSVLETYIVGEHLHNYNLLDTTENLNLYGFAKYECSYCKDISYFDVYGDKLEVAQLKLSSDKTVAMSCANLYTAELLIVPDTVTSFADVNMFNWQETLRYVLFSNNLIELSLPGTGIEHIYIPNNSDIYLGNCQNLKTVIWADGIKRVDKYGYKSYYDGPCVERGVTESSIQNIVIPVSVTLIKEDVFFNCNDLTSVYYMGTAEQWNDIAIADGNIWLTEANRYYYSESKPTVEGNFWHYVDGVPTVW